MLIVGKSMEFFGGARVKGRGFCQLVCVFKPTGTLLCFLKTNDMLVPVCSASAGQFKLQSLVASFG